MTPLRQVKKARRETGQAAQNGYLAIGKAVEMADIEAQILALETLTTGELQTEWSKVYRAQPPIRLSRDLLLRGVAYRAQEHAYGGLSLSIKRRLRTLSKDFDRREGTGAAPTLKLKPGTKLVREWHRQIHTVGVLDNGFEYEGQTYRSLTGIARRITGSRWSGPRFFGIGKHQRVAVGAHG
jgi:Protein of unknown function (DUF2924)